MALTPEDRNARIERNKSWYREHPKTAKFLKISAALTVVLTLIAACDNAGDKDTTAVADAPAAVADAPGEQSSAEANKKDAEDAAAEQEAARQARIEARKEARQARIEAREEAARQARIAARKEAARQKRLAERKARRAAAAQRRQEAAASQVWYDNCSEVEAAGAAPIYRGDPGFGDHLDRDGDGVACEQ